MDIDDAREAKLALEQEIRELLDSFSDETGLKVKSITLDRGTHISIGPYRYFVKTEVALES